MMIGIGLAVLGFALITASTGCVIAAGVLCLVLGVLRWWISS